MKLLIIRHAIAEDRDAFARAGHSDALRPLTNKGRRRMSRIAAGLQQIVNSVDVLATSPLVRARQTAEIVAEAYGSIPAETVAALSGAAPPADLLPWLKANATAGVLAVVGHEPHLGKVASWLLSDQQRSFVSFKKGGAALLEFGSRAPEPGAARLRWLMTPKQLSR